MMRRVVSILLTAVAACCPAAAQSPLTKSQLEAVARLDSMTIPTPGEFFAALDKQGQLNWSQLFQPLPLEVTSSRAQMALMLGVLIGDGYIAVEAQDSQGVKNVGKDIIRIAKKLNVSQTIIGRGNSINDFAENNDWSALREELEATQNEAKIAMAEQKDQDLVTLVTIGAWIRGCDAAAGYVAKNYSPQLAELLRQPAIVDFLLGQMSGLPPELLEDPLVTNVRTGLEEIRKLVSTPAGEPLSENAVGALDGVITGLVETIGSDKEEP
ncbi:MAG: hypothetical protein SFU53_02790 [Terrimicrobiaceae bacterium]|nr:hypothetical protein [Terrimicrobiaceae bacterium]